MDRKTEDLLCELQAQLYVQRIALRALARTHPDPEGLLSVWREVLREAGTLDPVAPGEVRRSEYVGEQMHACAELWTAELVDLAVSARNASPAAYPR